MHLRFDYAETAFRFMFELDGQPFTARDVVASFEAMLDPKKRKKMKLVTKPEALEVIRDAYLNPTLVRLAELRSIVVAQRYIRTFIAQKRFIRYKKDFIHQS